MELEYDLTYDDHLALRSYLMHEFDLARRTPLRTVATAVIAAAFVLYAVTRPAGTSPTRLFVEFGVGLSAVAFLLRAGHFFRKRILDRTLREEVYGGGPTEHMRLILEPDSLATQSEWSSGRVLWAAVRDIGQTDTHIFMMLPSGEVMIVPKRAFDSAQHVQAFLDELHRLRAEAAGTASAASTPVDSTTPSLR